MIPNRIAAASLAALGAASAIPIPLAQLDFAGSGTTDRLDELKSNPRLAPAIQQLERSLGVTIDQ